MNFEKQLIDLAKKCKKSIVFPEVEYSQRILLAVKKILKLNLCKVILLGKEDKLKEIFKSQKSVLIIDPNNYAGIDEMTKLLFKAREKKGLTYEGAKTLIRNEIYFGTILVKSGLADGMVCGAETPSADVIRPALQLLRKNEQFISSCTLLAKKNRQPLIFADCALNIYPDSHKLTDIAINTAKFAKNVCGFEPIVAVLSYSTCGSGHGESVDKMVTVVKNLKKKKVDFKFFGEVQFDSAVNKNVATKKKVDAEFKGQANVMIFPNIDAGNIGYKIAQELAGYEAFGPITLNLDAPVNDLSRGCRVEDIIYTTCITILQTKL